MDQSHVDPQRRSEARTLNLESESGAVAGLTSAEANRRLGEFGPNAVAEATTPRWRAFVGKLWSPVPWMLEATLLLQIAIGAHVEATVIAGLLLLNATLGLIQEGRAAAALAALRQGLAPTALVRRDGKWMKLAASDVVPGDAIRLPLGAVVPADARLVSGSLMVDLSMLTGESVPIEMSPGEQVYASSLVRRGQAIAEVTATGSRTAFGRTAELVRVAHATSSEQRAILGVARILAIVNGVVAVLLIAGALAIGMPMADLIRLALTALLATIPVALPATFTLSAALGAQILARRGVLLTRLSAAHETAAMDLLCADKTGTLTRNALEVAEVVPMSGIERDEVLALAARASSEGEQDPIDAAVRAAASDASRRRTPDRLVRFVPFDPATKIAEAWTQDSSGQEHRTIKGAFEKVASVAVVPDDARHKVDALAERGYRVLAIATGPPNTLRLVGLMALSDPPRDDSADLIATLSRLGVRTIMVTGDSAVTAGTIAREVGITGPVCPPDGLTDDVDINRFGVFARIVPEEKYRLVKAAQHRGHVVGMCGDGTNDAPALRQAQIGIAVSSATDIAKAAASLILTEPGLGGIVSAVREGRAAFQRLLTYTLNMLVKKFEIVLFLAIGLGLTRHPVMTPVLMVLMMVTNDFLSMSLTTDRAMPSSTPSTWQMRRITVDAVALGLCKLAFSTSLLAFGAFTLALDVATLQTLAFVTLVCGNQALLYVLRERQHLWHSMPGRWVLISSVVDLTIVWILAGSGTLMAPLPAGLIAMIVAASIGFALILDQIKRLITATFKTPPDLVSAAIRLEQ